MAMSNQTYRHHLLERRHIALLNAIDALKSHSHECKKLEAQLLQAHKAHSRAGGIDNTAFWLSFRGIITAFNQIQLLDSIPEIKPAYRPNARLVR